MRCFGEQYRCIFLRVLQYFDEPAGLVKIQRTRYCTPKQDIVQMYTKTRYCTKQDTPKPITPKQDIVQNKILYKYLTRYCTKNEDIVHQNIQ